MNNDAFRALINQQRKSSGAEKSTKEIAREAVENEFENKRRRGGGGGGGRRGRGDYDDSDGSSDDETGGRNLRSEKDASAQEERDVPEWKRRRREKRLKEGGDADAPEYRDRAKERREGNNVDYADLQGLTQSGAGDRKKQVELSKYLGGDEEHTHLVKGLDKMLAEKVRREDMAGGATEAGDLDQLLEEAYASKQGRRRPQQAQDWQTTEPTTQLGKSVRECLLRKKHHDGTLVKSNPTIQKAIQRSVLTFSLEADVRHRQLAWEVPRISVRASGHRSTAKVTPLSQHMIQTIAKKLDAKIDAGAIKDKEGSKYHVRANGEGQCGTKSDKVAPLGEDSNRQANTNEGAKRTPNSDDSEDATWSEDIFENAGVYVALAPTAAKPAAVTADPAADENGNNDQGSAKDVSKRTKHSVFQHLMPAPAKPAAAPKILQRRPQPHVPRQAPRPKRNVIERDVFGGPDPTDASGQTPYATRRGPTSAAIAGVSMTGYQGGYGEEMDVDFGGDEEGRRKEDDDVDEGGGDGEGEGAKKKSKSDEDED